MKTYFTNFIKDKLTNYPEIIYERIRISNYKPAVEFDKFFGTNLSQKYKFPDNLTDDEVWKIYVDCKDNDNYDKFDNILNKLDYSYFPYNGIELLSDDDKCSILLGMASGFNYDDIIWYTIDKMPHYKNKEVNDELKKIPHIERKIEWVLSPKTLKKLKKQLNIHN